jgi:hypothetical protein
LVEIFGDGHGGRDQGRGTRGFDGALIVAGRLLQCTLRVAEFDGGVEDDELGGEVEGWQGRFGDGLG